MLKTRPAPERQELEIPRLRIIPRLAINHQSAQDQIRQCTDYQMVLVRHACFEAWPKRRKSLT
jgi:hypothetical protein